MRCQLTMDNHMLNRRIQHFSAVNSMKKYRINNGSTKINATLPFCRQPLIQESWASPRGKDSEGYSVEDP
ncbi:hypothetical protein Pan181_32250 [Aeoliella mucimassa]|uniref:Uncharacterized protein n=1 Tax=Aeoliella mucimassa TaxID=2527972 RepID=A0A518AQK5_9BACT|nr:hypothetical protein Pan181_32250 [Aeoliella mucimassa]